jgi:hypothetical protein
MPWLGRRVNLDLAFESIAEAISLDFDIVTSLEVQPEQLAVPEEAGEAQSRIRSDPALAVDDFVDSPWRHADVLGQPVLGDSHGLQKLFQEDLSWVDRGKLLLCHRALLSVVVDDLDIVGIAVEPDEEHNAPRYSGQEARQAVHRDPLFPDANTVPCTDPRSLTRHLAR